MLGIERLQEAYFARFPGYERGITVPAIVDVPTGQVVTNDYAQMTLDLSTEWTRVPPRRARPTSTRSALRDEIDEVNAAGLHATSTTASTGAGSPASQEAYEQGVPTGCSTGSTGCRERLAGQRYLVGDTITEADVRLFTTLVRFDAVYHGHFKCNRQKLTEMPVLWAYARDLFQTPGFGDTIDFDHIKRHYYEVHRDINPTGIVPARPGPVRLADPARPRGARRSPVRRRHPAPAAARGRGGPGRAHPAGRLTTRRRRPRRPRGRRRRPCYRFSRLFSICLPCSPPLRLSAWALRKKSASSVSPACSASWM